MKHILFFHVKKVKKEMKEEEKGGKGEEGGERGREEGPLLFFWWGAEVITE